MNKLPQKMVLSLSAVVSTLLLTGMLTGPVARADVGPMDPARAICMGSSAGAPCTFEGKAGTCQGPHASRMYCTPITTPAKPVKPTPVDPAKPEPANPVVPPTDPATPPTPPTPNPTPATVEPAKPTPAPVLPTTPAKPPRKSGCAVSSAQSLPAPLTLIGVVLGLGWITRRRRASRIGA